MREKAVTCFSSAAARMKEPPAYFGSAAFSQLRWTLAGDQRDERMRLLCRKLLRRLDGMDMPFYPAVGLMSHKVAQQRYVTGDDPWPPILSPYLDGVAIEFCHCTQDDLPRRCWWLFAEIAFDVARLAQTPVMWGGFADVADRACCVSTPEACQTVGASTGEPTERRSNTNWSMPTRRRMCLPVPRPSAHESVRKALGRLVKL